MTTSPQRPDGYDHRITAQISARLENDLQATMKANGCDRSTAIRALMRVGMIRSGEVSAMIERDRNEREKRQREGNRTGGRRGMATRIAAAKQAQSAAAQDVQKALYDAK